MSHAIRRNTLVAGLGLLLASAAMPIALADPPGYYFKDDPLPSAAASVSATGTAIEAQIAAVNRKADQALATAEQALREAHQASSSVDAVPADRGVHVQPTARQFAPLNQPDVSARSAREIDALYQLLIGKRR
jgi:hypothetical protein